MTSTQSFFAHPLRETRASSRARKVLRLLNKIQSYAWGSLDALPALLGQPPDGRPQAELWLGAHDSAPSLAGGRPLNAVIAEAPERLLGAPVARRFEGKLPFLLKVLAAAQPLSLQAHPSLAQAREGFARENAAGLPLNAPHRNYRDANHKPELLCALSEFHALCGFRAVGESVRLLRGLGVDTTLLERDGLRAFFTHVMTARVSLTQVRVVEGFERECALAAQLLAAYPGDPGLIGALLLNYVVLQPGDALFLTAGNLHAYVRGTGIELMANSDNVLRGGLTPKHVDVPELLRVLDFTDGPVRIWRDDYAAPIDDFRLTRLTVNGDVTLPPAAQILLVTSGRANIAGETLTQGESVFIGADERLTLSGHATVFRAAPGL